ncbi:hypothetical protein DH2020_001737 [Rehmannia glutinosa]|uniref:Uncharacterized protein n=1 Tax=Rehmannia glutinosa TaxID=99300 RepID=A0ABR0XS96_REHGL
MDNIKELAKEDVVTVFDSSDEGDEIKIDPGDACDVMLQEAEDVVTILGANPENDEVSVTTQNVSDTMLQEAEAVVTILGAAHENDEVNITTQNASDTMLQEAEYVTIIASSDEGGKVSNSNEAGVIMKMKMSLIMEMLKAFDETETGVKGLMVLGLPKIPIIFVRPPE